MTRFRMPSRSEDHLSNYWNALVRDAPAEEISRLAHLVDPADIAAIDQAHSTHERYEPDPLFARRLEQTLMDSAMPSVVDIAGTTPHRNVILPSRNGSIDSPPVSHRRSPAPRTRAGWTSIPTAHIAVAILLVLVSVAGTWWVANLQDDPQPMIAPAGLQDPDDPIGAAGYSDHPIVGAWEYPVGGPALEHGFPCWCVSVFTADGLVMGMDPRPDLRAADLSSHTVAFGIWQPTGARTAVSIVQFPADDGGYIERTTILTVSEDGTSMTSEISQRRISPEGRFAVLPNVPSFDMVRMTMPDDAPLATPSD